NHIVAERKKRNFDPFMMNFEDLAEKADNFGQREVMIYLKPCYFLRMMPNEFRYLITAHLKNQIRPFRPT
ncbi:MAG: hypothetical protein QOK52_10545, partial [Nitrososphaeraceae archaeon]|nr:hypothetical protein [Nitrososphaeraceae archaeon]